MAKRKKKGGDTSYEALAVFLFTIGLLAVILSSCQPGPKKATGNKNAFPKKITLTSDVVATDGDTLNFVDAKAPPVRLLAINAPELDECYGKPAQQRLQRAVDSGQLALRPDRKLKAERYERQWLFFYAKDSSVNLQMVREGYAVPYRIGKEVSDMQKQLDAAADKAKQEKKGLWGVCDSNNIPDRVAVP